MKFDVREIYQDVKSKIGCEVILQGWIRNHRKQKEFGFIAFYDGTYFSTIQLVYDDKMSNFEDIQKIGIGSAITVKGLIVKSPKPEQEFEVQVRELILEGSCPEDYPMQPKQHSMEYLREMAYLRPRTNTFQAMFRLRSVAAMAIHEFFQTKGFVYLHAPILTTADAEGAGERFQVTTLDLDKIAKSGEVDYSRDFFDKASYLTVSGQLQGEIFALAYKNIYTFGPTFRAENSNTKTHANEFWMMEPEMAFCDLDKLMDVEEEMLKYIIDYVFKHAKTELEFFDKFIEKGLIERLTKVLNSDVARITHKEAIDILLNSGKKFEFEPKQGEDIAREHEKYLTDVYFNAPVFVTNWPKEIKAFYMRLNDDNETVAAVDFLVPGSGELVGGSQREERYDVLVERMKEMNVPVDELDWYLNLRKFGGVKHSGFGMGFERLLMYLTGMENIRDVIPFPRTPGNCEY